MNLRRSHSCGELTQKNSGQEVILSGWVQRRRDHGGVIFVDLRDRTGIKQVVFNPKINSKLHKEAEQLRSEYVISVKGKVEARPEGMKNPKMKTGDIEIEVTEFEILSSSKPLPLMIEERIVSRNLPKSILKCRLLTKKM